MNSINKLKSASKFVFSEKDYLLVCKFIENHDFDSFAEIVSSELKKEYKKCSPEKMTDRYCVLSDINYKLIKYNLVLEQNDENAYD